jgi:small-conductance mechanosensitive channel
MGVRLTAKAEYRVGGALAASGPAQWPGRAVPPAAPPGLYQAPTRREHGTAGFLCALPYRSFVPKRVELEIGDESIANHTEENLMNNIIYIVGLVVIVLIVLSFFGLR